VSESSAHFLDACILIYAVGRDHPYREPCVRIIEAAAEGTLNAVTDAEVIQEIVYHFQNLRRRADGIRWAREFAEAVPEVLPVTRQDALRSLELLEAHSFLPPRDAIHLAVIQAAGIQRIITADRHFDRLPGIERIDPAAVTW
jgi:predicted nucleic acid-binding protein